MDADPERMSFAQIPARRDSCRSFRRMIAFFLPFRQMVDETRDEPKVIFGTWAVRIFIVIAVGITVDIIRAVVVAAAASETGR